MDFYKLSDTVFFLHALGLHLVSISIALTCKKIDFIFDLLGSITTAFSIFLFPAIGFLAAYGRQKA